MANFVFTELGSHFVHGHCVVVTELTRDRVKS